MVKKMKRLPISGKPPPFCRSSKSHTEKQSGHWVCVGVCDSALCLPCRGELSCQWLCDEMSYLAAHVPIPSNMPALPSVLNTPLYCLPQKTSTAAGWKNSLQGAKEEGREDEKRKGQFPEQDRDSCKWDANEGGSLQWQRSTEGSSLLTVTRLRFNLLSPPVSPRAHRNTNWKHAHMHGRTTSPPLFPAPKL